MPSHMPRRPAGAEPDPKPVDPGPARESRFLVPVDGKPGTAALIRETCKMARARGVAWAGAHLDASQRVFYTRAAEERLSANLGLVEGLGGDLVRLPPTGPSVPRMLLALARARGMTDIVLAGPGRFDWLERLGGPRLEDLARACPELTIHRVVPAAAPPEPAPRVEKEPLAPRNLIAAVVLVGLATAASYAVFPYLGLADVMMVYMLCITVTATQFGRWTTLIASVLSILSVDFCFIDPRYTFVLTDFQHLGTFAVLLGVGWVVLGLAERNRAQTRLAQERERHSRALYRVGEVLAEGGTVAAIQQRVQAYLRQELEVPLALLLCDGQGRLPEAPAGGQRPDGSETRISPEQMAMARAALAQGQAVGQGTGSGGDPGCLMLPMPGSERPMGVLALFPGPRMAAFGTNPLSFLVPLASQVSLALERAVMAEERTEAWIRAEREQLRSTLLSSISHDLRTPLGTITGATTTLLDPGPEAGPGDHKVLLNTIHQESRRLLRMVNNLLDITRLESGHVQLKREWAAIEEVVGSTLSLFEEQLESRPVTVELAELWVPMDPVLFGQALQNILDNALKFSPPGTALEIRGWVEGQEFRISVADRGPGIAQGEEERIFDKLYRGTAALAVPGAGLGLAICKGIIQAHGGTIAAKNRPGGGTEVTMTLPLEGLAPEGMPPELSHEMIS
jgi:two-component system sensor histidine kinase KdpD